MSSIYESAISKDTRYFPALLGLAGAGLLLMFNGELSEPVKNHSAMSLIIYAILAAFVAYLQTMLNIRNNGEKISQAWFRFIVSLHLIIVLFITWYNFCYIHYIMPAN